MNFVGLFATQSQVEYIITRPRPPQNINQTMELTCILEKRIYTLCNPLSMRKKPHYGQVYKVNRQTTTVIDTITMQQNYSAHQVS